MLRYILAASLLSLALPFAAQADDFDYTYVEGAYTSIQPAHQGSSLTGPTADGSYAVTDSLHAFAGYQHVNCCDLSRNSFDAGAGWNTKLAPNVDLFIDGEFLSVNSSGNGTDSGWGASGGLRAWLAERFELDGFVSHTDISGNTENILGVRALWSFDAHWRVFASVANDSDANTFMLGARYVF
ncbi:MAG: hypothetical protein ACHQ7M_22455 [Chloroflexota bacterium]